MLLFPKLVIRKGRCVFPEDADRSKLYEEPTEMARMLRVMNARSLLVVHDPDPQDGADEIWPTISSIASAVDIPVQLEIDALDSEQVERAFDAGAYRCVVKVSTHADASAACRLLQNFGASRLTVRFPPDLCLQDDSAVADLVVTLSQSACSRIILTLDEGTSWRKNGHLPRMLDAICNTGATRRIRVSIDGGILDSLDLLALSDSVPSIVDSVIMHESFFNAKLPCQAFWCWSNRDSIDLDQVSTATLKC